jgi:hypothetical protein
MIIILTDQDIQKHGQGKPIETIPEIDFRSYVTTACMYAEDVYFWRDGTATAMKRRNTPLVVPDWLRGLVGVDQ